MTKKIIAILLLIASFALILCSCGDSNSTPEPVAEVNGVDETIRCYAASQPTKIVTNTVQQILNSNGDEAQTLTANYITVVGKIGGLNAAVRTYEQEVLDSVNNGAGSFELPPVKMESGREEYLEGYGRRTNGGEWRPKGLNFAPGMGTIAIKFTEEDVMKVEYEELGEYKNKLTFTVHNKNIEKVFGYDYNGNNLIEADSNVEVEIINNGAVVTSVTISYSIDASVDFPERVITITTTYSYDVEKIEIATGEI